MISEYEKLYLKMELCIADLEQVNARLSRIVEEVKDMEAKADGRRTNKE